MIDVETFISICFTSFFLFLMFAFLGNIYLALTIGRKFDKIFPNSPYGDNGKGFDAGVRAVSYALYVVTKGKTIKNHSILAKQCYGDYDFNGNVTPRQRKACWAYFICIILAFTFGGTGYFLCKIYHLCSG